MLAALAWYWNTHITTRAKVLPQEDLAELLERLPSVRAITGAEHSPEHDEMAAFLLQRIVDVKSDDSFFHDAQISAAVQKWGKGFHSKYLLRYASPTPFAGRTTPHLF